MPTHSTAASGGLSSSLVILVLWLMSIVDLHMSTEQAIALVAVGTAGVGWLLNFLNKRGLVAGSTPVQPADGHALALANDEIAMLKVKIEALLGKDA